MNMRHIITGTLATVLLLPVLQSSANPQAMIAHASAAPAAIPIAQPWITHPSTSEANRQKLPIALQFRKVLTLRKKPRSLLVAVSADNRFVLYVNGHRVAAGPARGDMTHWRYELIDLARWLKNGENVIAAQVWSDGSNAPAAQLSSGLTSFMLSAQDRRYAPLDSGPSWQVRVDASRTSQPGMRQLIGAVGPTYYVAGPPEELVGAQQLPGWTTRSSNAAEAHWTAAVPAALIEGRRLVADMLPQMRYTLVPSGRIVRSEGVPASRFPQTAVTIPANGKATILIDAGRVLAAYPVLRTTGGRGATIKLTYTEAMYDKAKLKKVALMGQERLADRANVDGGVALGLSDTVRPNGAKARFAPFWWRAWRYVQIDVVAGAQPVTLNSLETWETGYPFQQKGHFISSDEQLNDVWRIGWMTALLDAHETYMDTAYWEQLQYIGDTRLQALISYDVAGDSRLAVQALDAFDGSRVLDGLPQASWPQQGRNSIPPFALLWIGMLHDYWMRQTDDAVLRRNLAGMRSVLDWYAPNLRPEGTLKSTPGWLFVDWKPGLESADRSGTAPDSCTISLLYLGALRQAADLERAYGDPTRAASNHAVAAKVGAGVQARCWDPVRRLYANTPDKAAFSQHANLLAVLYDVVPAAEQRALMERILQPEGIAAPAGITETSYYFSAYLAQALDHAGMTDRYHGMLQPWRDMQRQNFTTWPENPPPSRSDSHAWSAHPTTGLLAYVAGIQPAAPHYARVKISPNLGSLTSLDAQAEHPFGSIRTRYKVTNKRIDALIDLPRQTFGTIELNGKIWNLKPGYNRITYR
jgi:alpha-L-rhamnosidase